MEHLKQLLEHVKILGESGANDRSRVAVPASAFYLSVIQSLEDEVVSTFFTNS
jgi:hypothetical protein